MIPGPLLSHLQRKIINPTPTSKIQFHTKHLNGTLSGLTCWGSQVAQVLSDAATDRQAAEAKLEALRSHVKGQDVTISNLRHTQHLQRGEWEASP